MNPHERAHCPRCHYRLVPVHARERGHRRIVALACPAPYCDHVALVPADPAPRREPSGRVETAAS